MGDDPCAACGDDPDPGPQDPVAQINHPGDGETRKVTATDIDGNQGTVSLVLNME